MFQDKKSPGNPDNVPPFTVLQVGDVFSIPNPTRSDGVRLHPVEEGFLWVIHYMQDPAPEEVRNFQKGTFRYGLYQVDDIPFLVCKIGAYWSFDAFLNAHMISPDFRADWLDQQANALQHILINARTNRIVAMRLTGISYQVAGQLQNVCERQLKTYRNAMAVNIRALAQQAMLTTQEMITGLGAQMLTLGREGEGHGPVSQKGGAGA
jgi:hypothetical protein